MFGGKTKRDLDEVIVNLSKAYDFIDAYANSQRESNPDSIGYEAARNLRDEISHCFYKLQSIAGDSFMRDYTKKYDYCNLRLPNEYMAVFANPNALANDEVRAMLMKIRVTSNSAMRPQADEEYEARRLIDQYRQKIIGKI